MTILRESMTILKVLVTSVMCAGVLLGLAWSLAAAPSWNGVPAGEPALFGLFGFGLVGLARRLCEPGAAAGRRGRAEASLAHGQRP